MTVTESTENESSFAFKAFKRKSANGTGHTETVCVSLCSKGLYQAFEAALAQWWSAVYVWDLLVSGLDQRWLTGTWSKPRVFWPPAPQIWCGIWKSSCALPSATQQFPILSHYSTDDTYGRLDSSWPYCIGSTVTDNRSQKLFVQVEPADVTLNKHRQSICWVRRYRSYK